MLSLVVLAAAAPPPCPSDFACCAAGKDFCSSKAAGAFCDPAAAKGQLFPDKVGCACPFGSSYDAATQKCKGAAPAPAQGWTCSKASPKNACGACSKPEDCGTKDWQHCWAEKDAKCDKAEALALVAEDHCPPAFTCCGEAPDFCHKQALTAHCDPLAAKAQRFPGQLGCACPYGAKYDAVHKNCTDTPAVPTEGGYCTKAAPTNPCGACNAPSDCGGTSWAVCWASKDTRCEKDEAVLV